MDDDAHIHIDYVTLPVLTPHPILCVNFPKLLITSRIKDHLNKARAQKRNNNFLITKIQRVHKTTWKYRRSECKHSFVICLPQYLQQMAIFISISFSSTLLSLASPLTGASVNVKDVESTVFKEDDTLIELTLCSVL